MPNPTISEQLILVLNIAWAMSLGGILGLERTRQGKASGVRTYMLVAGAAAFVTAVGAWIADVNEFGDPARVMAAFIQGVGFLGAGAIVTGGSRGVSGITTAAGILYTTAIGASVALGFGLAASLVTLLGIVVLQVVGRVLYKVSPNTYDADDS